MNRQHNLMKSATPWVALQWAVVRALHWDLSLLVVSTSLVLISFGCSPLLLCSVYCYISMPLRGEADTTNAGESKSTTTSTHTGTNDWASFGKLFFVIASRSILFSVLSIFIPILYITVINGEASASSLALTMYFAMGAVLPIWAGPYPIN